MRLSQSATYAQSMILRCLMEAAFSEVRLQSICQDNFYTFYSYRIIYSEEVNVVFFILGPCQWTSSLFLTSARPEWQFKGTLHTTTYSFAHYWAHTRSAQQFSPITNALQLLLWKWYLIFKCWKKCSELFFICLPWYSIFVMHTWEWSNWKLYIHFCAENQG